MQDFPERILILCVWKILSLELALRNWNLTTHLQLLKLTNFQLKITSEPRSLGMLFDSPHQKNNNKAKKMKTLSCQKGKKTTYQGTHTHPHTHTQKDLQPSSSDLILIHAPLTVTSLGQSHHQSEVHTFTYSTKNILGGQVCIF